MSLKTEPCVWKSTSYDALCPNSEFIFRRGQYSCQVGTLFNGGRFAVITDLITDEPQGYFKLGDDSIADFDFPYLLTQSKKSFRVWHLNLLTGLSEEPIATFKKKSVFQIPHHIFPVTEGLFPIQNAVIRNKTIIATDSLLKKITVIKEFDSTKITRHEDEGMDLGTGLLVEDDQMTYSIVLGNISIISVEDPAKHDTLPSSEEIHAYMSSINEENVSEHKKNIITSFVKENHILVGASSKTIQVWDLASKTLMTTIPNEEQIRVFSLNDRFVLGFNDKEVRILDIFSGTVLYTEKKHTNLPQLTYYNGRIIRVSKEETLDDITIDLPIVEKG